MSEAIEIYNGAPFKVMDGTEIWATQKDMAKAFEVNRACISEHISNIFESGELKESESTIKIATQSSDGKTYIVNHYNLSLIIAVGFRIKSAQGTRFRIWANGILHEYALHGYVTDERRKELLTQSNDCKIEKKIPSKTTTNRKLTTIVSRETWKEWRIICMNKGKTSTEYLSELVAREIRTGGLGQKGKTQD